MKNQKGVSLITLIITIIVVIILAVIVLRSGASDAPDQAAFSKFTSQMGEVQDAVKVAMLEAKADELLEGNQRTEAQLYNFVARGGYAGFEWEREYANKADSPGPINTNPNDNEKWVLQGEIEQIPCTPINKACAKESIGIELPEIKVETEKGVGEEISFFVTKTGTVFCWPPYVYDGKSYVNANTTVKSGDKVVEKYVNGTAIEVLEQGSGEELGGTDATKNGDFVIVFGKNDFIKVQNGTGEYQITVTRAELHDGTISVGADKVAYYDDYKYVAWYDGMPEIFGSEFNMIEKYEKMLTGVAKGCNLFYYNNSIIDHSMNF